jgi:hypothetical protein
MGEGDYHYGTGALANSLHRSGFRGILYIGFRGELPRWAQARAELELPGGMRIAFIPVDPDLNPNFQKAGFMLRLLAEHPEHRAIAYFDSDVVVTAGWAFFEDWSTRGVGLCMDMVASVPEHHPWRLAWRDLASSIGLDTRPLDYYCNGGFVLVPREHQEFLQLWQRAVQAVLEHLSVPGIEGSVKFGDVESPFHRSDQDAMAIAMMATSAPLSVVGPDGMSFASGLSLMTHAVFHPKPWHRRYLLEALQGKPPVLAHREYWKHVSEPLAIFGARVPRRARGMRLAIIVGSVFRRPRFWGAD